MPNSTLYAYKNLHSYFEAVPYCEYEDNIIKLSLHVRFSYK
jgi:hypothetical protein